MLVIGVGNEFRSDDAAGIEAARRIRDRAPHMKVQWGEPLDLLELFGGETSAVVIDAVIGGGEPGTIHRIDVSERPFPSCLSASTHSLGISDAIELARMLGRLPEQVVIFGIEVHSVGAGTEMTPEVESAIETVVAEVCNA